MTVEVSNPAAVPLRGSVSDGNGAVVPFYGLLELLALLQGEADRAAAREPAGRPRATG